MIKPVTDAPKKEGYCLALAEETDLVHSWDLVIETDLVHSWDLAIETDLVHSWDLAEETDLVPSWDLAKETDLVHSWDLAEETDLVHSWDLAKETDLVHSWDLAKETDLVHSWDLAEETAALMYYLQILRTAAQTGRVVLTLRRRRKHSALPPPIPVRHTSSLHDSPIPLRRSGSTPGNNPFTPTPLSLSSSCLLNDCRSSPFLSDPRPRPHTTGGRVDLSPETGGFSAHCSPVRFFAGEVSDSEEEVFGQLRSRSRSPNRRALPVTASSQHPRGATGGGGEGGGVRAMGGGEGGGVRAMGGGEGGGVRAMGGGEGGGVRAMGGGEGGGVRAMGGGEGGGVRAMGGGEGGGGTAAADVERYCEIGDVRSGPGSALYRTLSSSAVDNAWSLWARWGAPMNALGIHTTAAGNGHYYATANKSADCLQEGAGYSQPEYCQCTDVGRNRHSAGKEGHRKSDLPSEDNDPHHNHHPHYHHHHRPRRGERRGESLHVTGTQSFTSADNLRRGESLHVTGTRSFPSTENLGTPRMGTCSLGTPRGGRHDGASLSATSSPVHCTKVRSAVGSLTAALSLTGASDFRFSEFPKEVVGYEAIRGPVGYEWAMRSSEVQWAMRPSEVIRGPVGYEAIRAAVYCQLLGRWGRGWEGDQEEKAGGGVQGGRE
ncbi:hypothetical protein ACOMHN_002987 [Nucella lapillus]